jgi:hypothetical protein
VPVPSPQLADGECNMQIPAYPSTLQAKGNKGFSSKIAKRVWMPSENKFRILAHPADSNADSYIR